MKLQVCVRCKKRPASVYITRLDGGNSVNEGLCFQCAAELGIKPPPVVDMLKKMGIDEDAIEGMSEEISSMMEGALVESEDGENGKVPTLNLSEIFGMPSKPQPDKNGGAKSEGGTSGNSIRGVSKLNPKGPIYHEAADNAFGNIAPYTGLGANKD